MKLPVAIVALLPICAIAADVVSKYEQPEFRSATVYARGSNRKTILFKLDRTTSHAGNYLNVTREFTYPGGNAAVREHVTYQGNNLLTYDLEDLQTNTKGTAKVVREGNETKIVFDFVNGTKHKSNTETFDPDTVNNDMFWPFLRSHWNDLVNGRKVKFRYLAIGRAETVGFEFRKERETIVNGKAVIIVKMIPSSALVATFVDPLIFTIDKEPSHRVIEYDGRTPLKIKVGEKFKDLDALTVFE